MSDEYDWEKTDKEMMETMEAEGGATATMPVPPRTPDEHTSLQDVVDNIKWNLDNSSSEFFAVSRETLELLVKELS